MFYQGSKIPLMILPPVTFRIKVELINPFVIKHWYNRGFPLVLMSHKLCQPDMRNISHVCILYMTLDIITMLSFRDSPFNNCLQATATHLIVHGALKLLGAEAITIFMRNTKYNITVTVVFLLQLQWQEYCLCIFHIS